MTSVLPTATFGEGAPAGEDDAIPKTQFIFTTQDGTEIALSEQEAARFLAGIALFVSTKFHNL